MTAVDIDKVVFFNGPETFGAWGRVLRAVAPYSANGRPLEPCGTFAAYQRHMRKDEKCLWCEGVPKRERDKRRAAS